MAVIDHLDTTNKLIYLLNGVRSYHPVDDLYHEVRALRRTDENLQKFLVPVIAAGNVPKGGGKYTPRYIIMQNGWRIVPEDTDHTLNVTGEQLTAEGGAGPDCFDFTVLSAGTKITVNYEPPAAEVITVAGGSGLDQAQDATLTLIRKFLQNRIDTNPTTGKIVLYDDNNAVLLQADLFEDVDGAKPYSATSARIDRRNRLT